ncbi:MAG: tyrosine-type recombinase/integrase [Candidatus Binataceae bacterium]
MKLTSASIEAIKPPATGQVELRDQTCRGLVLRVSQGGSKTWAVRYVKNGHRKRYNLGRFPQMGLADARTAAKVYLGNVANGGDPAQERAEAKAEPTFAEVAAEYLERHAVKKRPRGRRADIQMLNYDLLPAWGDWKISSIERRHIIGLLDKIVDRGAPASANRTKTLISAIFNFCENRAVIKYNPAVRLPAPAPERSRDRWLSEDELQRLFVALQVESPKRQVIVRVALLTAARRGEILGMRWDELEGEWWTLPAIRVKNNREHRLPLVPGLLTAINELPRDGDEHVFHRYRGWTRGGGEVKITNVSDWFKPLLARAGIEDAVFHDLRRTAATMMNKIGIDPIVVERILNHVQGGVAAVYNRHTYDAEKRRALLRWERELDTIITGQKRSAKLYALGA